MEHHNSRREKHHRRRILYPFETKKKAEEVAKDWNETAKSEGKNLW